MLSIPLGWPNLEQVVKGTIVHGILPRGSLKGYELTGFERLGPFLLQEPAGD